MEDKLSADILHFLETKGKRGANLRAITLHLGAVTIEESINKLVNDTVDILNGLIDMNVIEECSSYDSEQMYRLRRFH